VTRDLEDTTVDLAAGLLEVLPRLLRRLRAAVPLIPPETADNPEWQRLAELRGASGQVALMSVLVNQQRATMQDLATQMAVTPATVTMMVKRLLLQGYVERKRDESDWRLVWINPTDLGRHVLHFYNLERRAALQRRLAQLSHEETECLRAALPALSRLVEVDE
jgi:MarR family transcriptional regulator, organic hydroperoxide resistance regulator